MTERTKIGPYTLYRRVGDGGMGEVHLAKREQLGASKWVAVKTIHPHLARKANFVASFLDEARVAMALNHPNVTQVFDLGQDADRFYLAMEYVHGETLQELMVLGPVPPHLAAKIVALASEGLHHAHDARDDQGQALLLVHRDVSPQNIFLTYEGHVKVTDFGIAWAQGRRAETKTGHVKGKMAYMPIEQLHAKEVDRRTDVFALGVVLWELLTGTDAFRADTDADTILRITKHQVQAPSTVNPAIPTALSDIVMKAMAHKPDERFDTARQLAHALEDYVAASRMRAGPSELSKVMGERFTAERAEKEQWLRGELPDPVAPPVRTPGAFAPTAATLPVGTYDDTRIGDIPTDAIAPGVVLASPQRTAAAQTTHTTHTTHTTQQTLEPSPVARKSPRLLMALAGAALVAAGAAGSVVMVGAGAPLRVSTTPSGAAVFVDDVQVDGATPLVLTDLAPGRHDLRTELEGFEALSATFDMGDEELELRYELSRSEPPQLGLDADEVDAGEVDAGEVDAGEVDAGEEGIEPPPQVVNSQVGAPSMSERTTRTGMRVRRRDNPMEAETVTPRAMGRLTVLATPWAQYRIVGTSLQGNTPISNLEVPAGRTVVELRAGAQGEWVRRVVNVEDGRTARIRHVFDE